jgi:hypothetical protein
VAGHPDNGQVHGGVVPDDVTGVLGSLTWPRDESDADFLSAGYDMLGGDHEAGADEITGPEP